MCVSVNLREFRFAQTMIFAIEEINKSDFLLPNVSIGYRVYDTCGSTLSSVRAAMALMNSEWTAGKNCSYRSSVHTIIGESESSSTIVLSRLAGPFEIPVVRQLWHPVELTNVTCLYTVPLSPADKSFCDL